MKNFSSIKIENILQITQGIKIQKEIQDRPRKVNDYHYCRSQPKVRHNPKLFGLSQKALQIIGLDYEQVKNDPNTPSFLSGSKLIDGSSPTAHNYCGYQFGNWAGQLGDGRAHTLGHIKSGNKHYQLQLKGSGFSPFSRHADGNSVLSSAVRQFLASQLMVGLGIPTTRAVSLVLADQPVKRDPLYNGVIKLQKAAIVLRMNETFLRFGSLEVCLKQGNMHSRQSPLQNRKTIAPLCDFAIRQHFPDINYEEEDPYEQLYKRLVKKSAQLVAHWQSIGFCHGVMNTDNMSLGGVTIDYGPFAFIDYFSKDYVSNATDQHQRYSFRRQPQIIQWNLERLAEAMDPLFPFSISAKYLKDNYRKFYEDKYYQLMSNKLGIENNKDSIKVIQDLQGVMHECGTHFTNFYRIIENSTKQKWSLEKLLEKILQCSQPAQFFLQTLRAFPQLANLKQETYSHMLQHDSAFNLSFIKQQPNRLLKSKKLSQQHCKDRTAYQSSLWKQWLQSYLPLLSKDKQISNPKYVLLNYVAKQIIQQVQKSTPEESIELISKILKVFSNPYIQNEWFESKYWTKAPTPIKLTCSS